MDLNFLYIDDDENDLERYSRLLQEEELHQISVNQLLSHALAENPELIISEHPDLILVDFDFSKAKKGQKILGIDGVTLSNYLRKNFPDIPIILLTRRGIFKFAEFPEFQILLESLDEVMYKTDLISDKTKILEFLVSLIEGYRKLSECKKKNWENLFSAIGAPNDDFNDLIASYPTNQLSHDSSWSIFTTTSWIRKTLMKYPGILYDAVHAATCLGISVDCFNEESLQTFFNKSKYDGPFSKERNLWWKSKLLEVANNDMTDDEIFLPLRLGFSNFWVRIHNEPLLPSVCIWSNDIRLNAYVIY